MFYSNLRWKIHDLEEKLEFEKQLNKRLNDEARTHWIMEEGYRKRINELEDLLKAALGAKDNGKEEQK